MMEHLEKPWPLVPGAWLICTSTICPSPNEYMADVPLLVVCTIVARQALLDDVSS